MSTGWYGEPGGGKFTKVHYVLGDRYPKPICGARIGPSLHFQFCAPGFEPNYVECARCRKIGAVAPRIKLRRRRQVSR